MPTVSTDNETKPAERDPQASIVSSPPPVDYRKLGGPAGTDTDSLLAPAAPAPEGPPVDFRRLGEGRAPSAPTTLTDELMSQSDGQTETEKLFSGAGEAEKLNQAVQFGADKSPEEAQRVLRLSQTSGLPEDLVERNAPEIEKFSRLEKFDVPSFAKSSPIISEWLSQSPNRTAATWRDLPHLERMEGGVEDYSILSAMYQAFGQGVNSLFSSAAQVPGFMYSIAKHSNYGKLAAPFIEDQGEGQFPVAKQVASAGNELVKNSKYGRIVSDALGSTDWVFHGKDFEERASKYNIPELSESISEHIGKGNYGKAGRIMAVQFAANAPQQTAIILGSIMGLGAPTLVGAGLVTAGQKFKEAKDAGKGETAATVDAALNGTIEAGFESLGTFGLLKEWEKALANKFGKAITKEVLKDFAKTMLHTVAGEANEEFWTSAAQDLSDYVTGVNPQALTGIGQRAVDAGIVGGFSGGLMTTPGGILQANVRSQAKQSALAQEFYESLGQTAEAMEIRQKLPEAQKEIVTALTKDGPIEKVYVPVEAIDQYFEAENPVKVMSDIGAIESYEEAKVTGGHVAIPLSTWIEKFVGTPAYQGLARDIKFSPTDLTANEVKDLEAQMQAEADKQEPDTAELAAGQIKDQLVAAGKTEDEAAADSAVFERWLRTLGRDSGIAPEELIKMYPLFVKQSEDRKNGDGFNQPARIEDQLQTSVPIPDTINSIALPTDQSFDGLDAKALRAAALKDAKTGVERGAVQNANTNWVVTISGEGLKKSASLSVRPEQAIGLRNIRSLIESSIYLRTAPDRTGGGVNYDYLYTPFTHNGETFIAKIALLNVPANPNRQIEAHKKFYSLHVQKIKNPLGGAQTISPRSPSETSSPSESSAISKADLLQYVNEARQTTEFFQDSLPAAAPQQSPIGFYSQVEAEVQKMDFKEMPAKDLANRIKNIQGIKAEELEALGIQEWLAGMEPGKYFVLDEGDKNGDTVGVFDTKEEAEQAAAGDPENFRVHETGRVTKEMVLAFISGNGVQVEQVVLSDDFKKDIPEDEDSDAPHIADLEWSEPEFMSYSEIANQYYGSDPAGEDVWERLKYGDEFEGSDVQAELDAWVAELKDDEDESFEHVKELVEIVKNDKAKYDERRQAMKKLIDLDFLDTSHGRHLIEKMEEAEIEFIESGESVHSIEKAELESLGLEMTRRYDSNWEIELPDGRRFETDTDDFNEAKIQIAERLLERGDVRGDESDLIQPNDIVFLDPQGELPSEKTVDKKTRDLYKKEGERLRAAVLPEDLYGDTPEEKEKERESEARHAARKEVLASYSDSTNKKNSVTIKIKHPFLNGTVTGNSVKGWMLDARLERSNKRIVENLGSIPAEEVQAKVLEVLKANDVFSKTQEEAAKAPDFDVNAPTGRSKFDSYKVEGGTNYREILLTLPNLSPAFTEGHWSQKNVLAHVRLTDRVGPPLVQSKGNKPASNGFSAHAELLADTVKSKPFAAKGLGGLKVERQQAVVSSVLAAISDDEVRRGVIPLIPVDMMNNIVGAELSAEEFLSNKAMLSDSLTANPNALVKLGDSSLRSFVSAVADLATKRVAVSPDLAGVSVDDSSAPGASDLHRPQRILFIEELQSDLHQKGRERGYQQPVQEITELPEGFSLKQDEGGGAWSVRNKSGAAFTAGYGTPEYATTAALQQLNENAKQDAANAIPDAPFKNTDAWAALAMKRIIRLAVEQGYDAVAWAPAEVHTDRWGTDSVSWVKTPEKTLFLVKDREQIVRGEFESHLEANTWIANNRERYEGTSRKRDHGLRVSEETLPAGWLVGSVEQVGGNADGVNIEEAARNRGKLLEDRGKRISTKEELRKVIAETLNRERNERSLEALTESVWKQMQEKDSGVKAPRKEGFEFFYNNLLPKKVVPGILKKLDKNAKVEVGKVETVAGEYDEGSVRKKFETVDTQDAWQVVLTPEMKAKAKEGFSLFQSAQGPYTGSVITAEMLFQKKFLKKSGQYSAHRVGNFFWKDLGNGWITRAVRTKEWRFADANPTIRLSDLPEWLNKHDKSLSVAKDLGLGSVLVKGFEQPGQNDPRGRIEFANKQATIFLPTWSDPSTVPHEMAHYFLEVLGGLSEMENATKAIKDRYAKVLKFLEVNSREELTREHHEKFARSFEAYLREGKAPSEALREVFERFKAWLTTIYKSVAPEQLTPEIKEFFDSILSGEKEVREAQKRQEMLPLFNDFKASGMTDDQAEEFARVARDAGEASRAELNAKVMAEADKKRSREYTEQRELIRAQVEEEVSHEPVYIALSVLQKGVFPDGTETPEGLKGLKLDGKALKKEYPGQMKSLPKPYVYAREGGIHPDLAAELLGFSSGSELITALVEAENREDLVERMTDERMRAEHPSLLETGALSVEAMKAIHNDKQDELYRKELEYLMSEHFAAFKNLARRIAARPPAATQAIKDQAKTAIDRKQVRETNPLLYQRAEAKAGKEAMDLYLKGDIAGAVEAKTRQRYNHALYRAAVEARENADKAAEYASKFSKTSVRERIGKAGSDYLEQIEAILERFDFRQNVSGKAIDRKNSLREWVASQQDEGIAVDLPEKLLNEAFRKNYKELTNAELAEVRETLENIEHLARLKNTLLGNQKIREMQDAEDMLLSTAQAHHNLDREPEDLSPGMKDKVIGGMSKFLASHTRMEFLFEFLDGGKAHGAFWNLLFQPFVEAENAETELAKRDTEALGKIFGEYSRKERAQWFTKKTFIRETVTSKFDGNVTHAIALSVALNWGNEYNRVALMEGYGWNEQQVMKILDLLDEKDVKTVNALWAHINTYWESARDLQKEMTGVAPAKVQGSPAVIRAGKLDGGYYPIKFNNDLSYRQFQLDEKAALGEQFGHATRAMTRHGHLIERTNTGGKPLLLNLSVLTGHLAQVRHDVTHRRAVIDVSRLISRPKVRDAITAAAGRNMYRQLNPWLKGIAGDTPPDLVDGWEKPLSRMRSGATVVNLGFKITSGIAQILGFSNTVNEIGLKYSMLGMRAANPFAMKENWAFITERSKMMENRLDNYDRDVRDYAKKQSAVSGVDQAWFYHIGMMDLALSIPSWLGAYQKAMDGGIENIEKGDEKAAVEYADSVVRKTMAAGAAKDLSQVQRGGELKRLFTAFYSQLNLQFNQLQQAGQNYKLTGDLGKLTSSLLLVWFLQAVGDDLLKGRGPDDDEEWLPWLLRKTVLYPFQTVVVGRDIVSALDRKIETGRNASFSPSPAFQAFEAVIDAAVPAVTKPFTGEEFTRSDARNVVTATGYALKLPTRQVWLTGEYLYDLATGEEQPSNPAEAAWRALVTGKKKDK